MYNEKYFKNHILWIRIKRLIFMLIFSIIGCIIGVISSSYIVDILLFNWNLKPLLIAGFTIVFFFISLLISSNSSRYVQDCLWKIETLHALNNLSDKLDTIKGLEQHSEEISNCFSKVKKELIGENGIISEEENLITENNESITQISDTNIQDKEEIICKENDEETTEVQSEKITLNDETIDETTNEITDIENSQIDDVKESENNNLNITNSSTSNINPNSKNKKSNNKKKNRKKNKNKKK